MLSFQEPGTYRCRLSVQDNWSGRWTDQDVQFVVEPWVGRTQPPVIDSVQIEQRPGGHVTLRYHVEDGAGLLTDISVHWGDETDFEALEAAGPSVQTIVMIPRVLVVYITASLMRLVSQVCRRVHPSP